MDAPNEVTASAVASPVSLKDKDLKDQASLADKISKCYGDITWITKNGRNEQQKYNFASADDIYSDVRKAMLKNRLAFIPIFMGRPEAAEIKAGSSGRRVTLPITFSLIDADTGYSIEIPWFGECDEYGDKAISKCLTAATKYCLRSLFLIPTGDDPDEAGQPVGEEIKGGEPIPATVVKVPDLKIDALLWTKPYEAFRAACAAKKHNPITVAQTAMAEGVKGKSGLLEFAQGLVDMSPPASKESLAQVAGAWLGSDLVAAANVFFNGSFDDEESVFASLSAGQAAALIEASSGGFFELPK